MKMDFIINKYLLIWYLLYESSISEGIHKLKQKLWRDHRKEYSLLHGDRDIILKDLDNYIPDDDLIFNFVESSDEYKKLKRETNKYRLDLLRMWDQNKKLYLRELNKLLRDDFLSDYQVLVIHPSFDILETDLNDNTIIIGKKINANDKDNFLTYLIYKIIKKTFSGIKTNDDDIVNAIIELLITNELFTRVTKKSKYNLGKKSLREIKEKIYPYWLMYMGVEQSDMEKYMVRDNIFFNISSYTYEDNLKNIDIFSFINFVLKNRRVILRKKIVPIEDIEIL